MAMARGAFFQARPEPPQPRGRCARQDPAGTGPVSGGPGSTGQRRGHRATVAGGEHQQQGGDPDQQRPGDVHPDQAGRQPAEVLGVADDALRRSGRAAASPAAGPARRPGQPQADDQRGGQPAQQPADVGVQLGDAVQRQVVAGHVRRPRPAARCRSPRSRRRASPRHRRHHAAASTAGRRGPAAGRARCPRRTGRTAPRQRHDAHRQP